MLWYFHASKPRLMTSNNAMLNYIVDRGQRALSSYLGGGDLDGDDFNLILDVSSNHVTYPFMSEHSAAKTATKEMLRTRRIRGIAHQNDRPRMWHLRCCGLRIRLCESHSDFHWLQDEL